MIKKSQLDEFRKMIDECDDQDSLDAAYALLSDVMQINAARYKISQLESGLTAGKKAMFYFFVSGLDEDEIAYASERVQGRLKRMKNSKEEK
jgi:hypothetical protein